MTQAIDDFDMPSDFKMPIWRVRSVTVCVHRQQNHEHADRGRHTYDDLDEYIQRGNAAGIKFGRSRVKTS